jgi:hypothetical protein
MASIILNVAVIFTYDGNCPAAEYTFLLTPKRRKASVDGFIFIQRLPINQSPPGMTENPDEQR